MLYPVFLNSNMTFIGRIENINKIEKIYDRIFRTPLEKIFGITWAIYTQE